MPHRRLAKIYTCAHCGEPYRPYHQKQQCCSGRCGALHRKRPGNVLEKAWAANRARYAKKLGAQIRGMTPGEIWRLAYSRGFSACWNKYLAGRQPVTPPRVA